jgi:hypothetical protein
LLVFNLKSSCNPSSYIMGLIIWTLLSRQLVVATTTKPNLGHLALAQRSQEDIAYHFKKGMVCQFLNGMVCLPATSDTGAR